MFNKNIKRILAEISNITNLSNCFRIKGINRQKKKYIIHPCDETISAQE